MKQVEQFRWYMPPWRKGAKPHLSSWHMDAETAARMGALRPEPSTREVREIPETDEEMARRFREMHGNKVTRPWWKMPEMIGLRVIEDRWVRDRALPELLALPVRQVRWLDDYWGPAGPR
ncbi:MAG: hypothetical protein HY854_16065 [Burkholderiales bacterium]|nr:hypothetical protein [Burkholderiales bacterium]